MASPSSPADLDLYLQQELPDGSWTAPITAGETGSLEEEVLTAGRQPPGRYRILVHNWAGGPQQAELTIMFFNQSDQAGGSGAAATVTKDYLLLSRSAAFLPQP
jgi:hypothetical protein